MRTGPDAEQAGEPVDGALALLTDPALDPFFRPQARSGIASAWHDHVPFAHWLVAAARPAMIVELGAHNGVSYAAFCETVLQEKLATRCYAVDSWTGDDHAGHYGERVYGELREFHDGRYGAFSELLRMTFDEARDVVPDGAVDLLHIDGFHSYDAVRHDFEAWAPKLSARAVVLFHDINVLGRGFGVARYWAEVEARFPSFSFLHGHGLGVLAVGSDVAPSIRRLCAIDAPSAIAALRERCAFIGRVHGLDYALRETARHERRLRREAGERDGVVDDLRRSLDEVLGHRDSLMAAQALAEQRTAVQAAVIASLREGLRETQGSLGEARIETVRLAAAARDEAAALAAAARDEAALLKAAVEDRGRKVEELSGIVGDLRSQAARDKTEMSRLQSEIEALRGHLTAARADAKTALEDGRTDAARLQAEIERRDGEAAALHAAAALGSTGSRPGFSLRRRRHA